MNKSLSLLVLIAAAAFVEFEAQASPTGAIVKQLSSVLKWTRSSPKTTQNDEDALQFESGYLVETIVEGNKLGVVPHTIRVSPEGELFTVDAVNNNIMRITPPLSQYSRARLVAGSFQGYPGHVDGKPTDARFNHPKGVTMDDKGNVYVADTSNLAIRKIGETGVTTIAGGKSNVAGYRDGPSEDAKFSTDFDIIYVGSTCSLIVVDRGNAALRQISLQQEDCDYQHSSVSSSDIVMVIGAVLAGYVSCLLQHGFGPSISPNEKETSDSEWQDHSTTEKRTFTVETLKEDVVAGWPSFGRLLSDLLKFTLEALGSLFLRIVPFNLRRVKAKKNLTPLRDRLVMPEDKPEPRLVQKQMSSSPMTETLHASSIGTDTPPKATAAKIGKPPKFKDPSLSSKHRSSKRQEFSEFYSPPEAQHMSGPKVQKDRARHRHHREKSGEVVFGDVGSEPRPLGKGRDSFRSTLGPNSIALLESSEAEARDLQRTDFCAILILGLISLVSKAKSLA